MTSISRVAELLDVDRDTVIRWSTRFAEYLSLAASTPNGKAREFNEADLRVLALVAEYWEDEPDYENIYAMLNCREQDNDRFIEFARLHAPIFQDVPEEVDETWQHGAMIGGIATRGWPQLARAYKTAADAMVTQALSQFEADDLAYPIIFLYRHTIELYLKTSLHAPPEDHNLSNLICLLERRVGKKLAPWIGDRIRDFQRIDEMSDVFRYAGGPPCNELWIDFHHLMSVMDRLTQAFETQMNLGHSP